MGGNECCESGGMNDGVSGGVWGDVWRKRDGIKRGKKLFIVLICKENLTFL